MTLLTQIKTTLAEQATREKEDIEKELMRKAQFLEEHLAIFKSRFATRVVAALSKEISGSRRLISLTELSFHAFPGGIARFSRLLDSYIYSQKEVSELLYVWFQNERMPMYQEREEYFVDLTMLRALVY